MSVKSDRWIEEMAINQRMIEPFSHKQISRAVISYGLSAYGYDIRVANEFRLLEAGSGILLNPKQIDESIFRKYTGEAVIIPPNSFILARSVEYFRIPRNIITITQGKSTYARCGIFVNVTPFEPEWEGYVTMAIANLAPLPVQIFANEGIAQVIFLESDEICQTSYADKKGKYQAQNEITPAKID
jgi:dCTP deaminase